ncbi:MAG: stalk domain-containing protein [Mycobacterium leprae]
MRRFFGAFVAVMVLAIALFPTPARGSEYTAPDRPALTAAAQTGGVLLQWSAPALDSGVVGYVVRRGSAPGKEDTWPINDFPALGTEYRDESVTPGLTYYYQVIPLLADGRKGKASMEAHATATAATDPQVVQLYASAVTIKVTSPDGTTTSALPQYKPVLSQGRVLLAMDDLVRITGAVLSIDGETGWVVQQLPGGRTMQMGVGNNGLIFRTATRRDIVTPLEMDGKIYLPVRWVVEAMGGQVSFDTLGLSVTIKQP